MAWGFWLCAYDQRLGLATVFAPVLMTFLLLNVSGVTLLEQQLVKSRPGYADYVRRTSAFWPRRPSQRET
jgi:steroid 5-alpha reductase family enzyme